LYKALFEPEKSDIGPKNTDLFDIKIDQSRAWRGPTPANARRRYTLCAHHHAEDHEGEWQTCDQCRKGFFETEMYVWYGTNEYNFVKLENPPTYDPTICAGCGAVIRLGDGGYSITPEKKYYCGRSRGRP
jgi:hypothetical protein